MVVDRKVTGTASSTPGGLALGWGVGMGITVLGAAVCAHLISKETIAGEGIGYCAMVIVLLSTVLGALVSAGKIKRRRLQVCLMSGAVYYATLLAGTALFFGGQYQGMGVTGLLVLAGCGVVILMGMNGGKQRRPRKRKIGNR